MPAPRVSAMVATVLLATAPAIAIASGTPADTLAAPARLERWREDLRALGSELPMRHGDLFWRTPATVFHGMLDSLERALPTSPDWRVVAGIARVCALADAHTTLQWSDAAAHFHRLPIVLGCFTDGWRVITADSTHAALTGMRLVAVEDRVVDRAAAALAPFLSSENEAWLAQRLALAFVTPELIAAAGLAADPDSTRLRFVSDDGLLADVCFHTSMVARAPGSRAPSERSRAPLTLARRDPALAYWFALLPETHALLFRYNACVDVESLRFDRFAARLWRAADSARVERVVVDLRANTGGNSRVWEPFVRALLARHRLARPDRLSVLVSGRTYSSAVLDAWELRRRATVIGQPTGGKPNGWGEVKSFRLPISQLDIQYSTRFYRLIRDADPPSLMPDLPVSSTWADLVAGRDAALEAALGK